MKTNCGCIMDIKIKCTQCGCEYLEEVEFPYEAKLNTVAVGLSGESFQYALDNNVYAITYICTRCGHFEFFNPRLAELVLKDREKNAKIQQEIMNLDKKILENNNEIEKIEQQINSITTQLKNIDITIRQSNELKANKQKLITTIERLKKDNKKLFDEQKDLKKKLSIK